MMQHILYPSQNSSHQLTHQLIEHLKGYFNGDWKTQANIKQTMAITAKDHMPLKQTLQDPNHSVIAPLTSESMIWLHSAPKGFLPIDPSPSTMDVYNTILTLSAMPSATTLAPGDQASSSTVEVLHALSRKRVADVSIQVQPTKKPRQAQSCKKCASGAACHGRKEVKFCQNLCKDCRKVNCQGHNPKKLILPCNKGWE
jgi:hypothetical protein